MRSPNNRPARRHLALVAMLVGVAMVLTAQRVGPVAGPPLFDGVVVADPYRWLDPPSGELGGAQGASDTVGVQGASPVIALATPEEPPQAQIFAPPGSLILPSGTKSLALSIQPVQPVSQPPGWTIAGNVYRISVVNQGGASATGKVGGDVTVVLRGPPSATMGVIERYANGSWQEQPTDSGGLPAMFVTSVTYFGDFAVAVPAIGSTSSPTAAAAGYSVAEPFGTPGEGNAVPDGRSSANAAALIILAAIAIAAAALGVVVVLHSIRRRR
jgi:hypothetical protein